MNETRLFYLEEDKLDALLERAAKRGVEEYLKLHTPAPILEIMTKTELADYLRCSVSKVNSYMGKGLPFFMFGEHPRYRKSEIDRWLSVNIQKVQREAAEVVKGQELG